MYCFVTHYQIYDPNATKPALWNIAGWFFGSEKSEKRWKDKLKIHHNLKKRCEIFFRKETNDRQGQNPLRKGIDA